MPARWTPTATGRVTRRDGPGPLASFLGAMLTFALFTLVVLVAAATLIPGSFIQDGEVERGDGRAAAALPSTSPSIAPSAAPLPGAPAPFAPDPTPSPRPTVAPRAGASPVTATITGGPAPVQVDGGTAVQVRVEALKAPARSPITLAPGRRLMVAVVRVGAQDGVRYDASHWFLEDTSGKRWKPLIKAPTAPLGAITVRPDADMSGQVAFSVPTDREISSVVLTDGEGRDLAVFDRAQAAR